MSQIEDQVKFQTLFEFLVNYRHRNHRVLRDPMCETILLQRKNEASYSKCGNPSPYGLFPVHWQGFMETEFFKNLLHELPVIFYELMADFHIFFKTPSCLLVKLSHVTNTICKMYAVKCEMEITSLDLLSKQSNHTRTNIGSNLERLGRLKDEKQNDYILKLLLFSREFVNNKEETKMLVKVLGDLAKNLRKVKPSSLLPIQCFRDMNRSYSIDDFEMVGKASASENKDICKFLSTLVITLIPLKSVFGTCKLRRIFIRELIKLIRNCSMFDKRFLAKLPFADLVNSDLQAFSDRPKVICNVLYIFVTDILFPLLKDTFHVAKMNKNLMFYYKPLWIKLQDLGFKQLSLYFCELEREYVDWLQLSGQLFGIYAIVIQPKPHCGGFRLISMLNKTASCNFKIKAPVNANLMPIAAILKCLWKDSNIETPHPIRGKVDLEKKIATFKSRLRCRCNGTLPKLYFFKCDAENCYDNIPLKELQTEVLNWLHWSPFYHILKVQRYCHVTHRTHSKTIAISSKQNGRLSFKEIIDALEKSFKTSTISLTKYKVFTKEFAKRNVEFFLLNSILYHDERFYRRKRGIPQGASISKLLCDFYFCHMFKNVSVGPDSLFLSATDDFLYISSNKTDLCNFMKDILRGDFNFILNKKKTESYLQNKYELLYYGVKIKMT